MPLNLVNCGICGKATVVDEEQRHICDACREEELQLYRRVRTLISENPGAGFTIWDVADKLKEDEGKITHLLDSGYFTLTMQGIQLCKERDKERDRIF